MPGVNGAPAARLLVVEDDDGDALLVEELLLDSGEPFAIDRARSAQEAAVKAPGAACALVDLGLPDAHGLQALTTLQRAAPDVAVVVLTGLADRARGVEAMAAGAQDYLVKGEVDGPSLARAIRYAIERRRAEDDTRRLLLSERRQLENDRLARGLLPLLHVTGPDLAASTRYRPGADALLGGDFFDAFVTDEGLVRAVIGDVCGHGPAEAAVGVALRIAWRTMVLAGAEAAETLASVEAVLHQERDGSRPFATICDVTVDPRAREVTIRRHGHPPPLLVGPEVRWLDEAPPAPPLGCFAAHIPAVPASVELPERWSMLLLTDGIYEGRDLDGRVGMDGLVKLVDELGVARGDADGLLDALVDETRRRNGGDLDDDIALLWLGVPG